MKKTLQIIATIGLISANIGYASEKQYTPAEKAEQLVRQEMLNMQQMQNIPTKKQIQNPPAQTTNWFTCLKQWFTPKPGPEYKKLPIINIKTKSGTVTKEESFLLLPRGKKSSIVPPISLEKQIEKQIGDIKKEQRIQEKETYKIEKIGLGPNYYLKTIPSSKISATDPLKKSHITKTTSGGIIPLQDIKEGKTYVTPKGRTYEIKSFKPTSKLYPESKKTQKIFREYGGGWE